MDTKNHICSNRSGLMTQHLCTYVCCDICHSTAGAGVGTTSQEPHLLQVHILVEFYWLCTCGCQVKERGTCTCTGMPRDAPMCTDLRQHRRHMCAPTTRTLQVLMAAQLRPLGQHPRDAAERHGGHQTSTLYLGQSPLQSVQQSFQIAGVDQIMAVAQVVPC